MTLSTLTKHTHSADIWEMSYLLTRGYQMKIEILLLKFKGCILNWEWGAKFLEAIR